MELKTVEIEGKTYGVIADGKPVYIHDDGKEAATDVPFMAKRISQLNHEAQKTREAKEALEGTLKAFEGLDAEAAKKAMETVKNLDDKKLVEAGEVEKVKQAAVMAYEEKLKALEAKYAPVVKERDSLANKLVQEKIGTAFSRSQYIAEKLAVPSAMVQPLFGDRFRVEDDAVVGYESDGKKQIYSRTKLGEIAGFDEALEIIVEASGHRDYLLKGAGGGGGANGGHGAPGAKQLTRSQFEALSPQERGVRMAEGYKVVD